MSSYALACRTQVHMQPKELGKLGERLVAESLINHGHVVLAKNWHCLHGEADLIVCDTQNPHEVIFVEVKSRFWSSLNFDLTPEEAVTAAKQRRYQKIAQCFLAQESRFLRARFDVAAVLIGNGIARLHYIRNAFGRQP